MNHYLQPSAPFNQTSYSLAKQGRSKRKPCVLFDCCLTWMAWAPGAPRSHGFFQRFQKRHFWRAMPGGIHRGVPTALGSFFQKEKEEKFADFWQTFRKFAGILLKFPKPNEFFSLSSFFFLFFLKEWARRGGDTPMDAPRLGPPVKSFLETVKKIRENKEHQNEIVCDKFQNSFHAFQRIRLVREVLF